MSPSAEHPHLTVDDVRAHTRDALPVPGAGGTWRRWSGLRDVAADDLPLAKLVEPHHDAAAILAELGGKAPGPDDVWGVWAAEPPFAVLTAGRHGDGWTLSGSKAFCSGADLVTHALVTAEAADGPRLFAIALDGDGTAEGRGPEWVGAGMRRARTTTLSFTRVPAEPVGEPGEYVARPGFWWGAIGVAACWLGGAHGVARTLEEAASRLDAHGRAHLGAVRSVLDVCDLALEQASRRVDDGPSSVERAERLAQSLRAHVAQAAEDVISHAGRALGPGPLAFDGRHAAHVADLQVFVRQHHGERDLERLGSIGGDDA